jgi:hypothetical protein
MNSIKKGANNSSDNIIIEIGNIPDRKLYNIIPVD